MIANQFIQQGFSVRLVLNTVELSSGNYYYQPSGGKNGRKPSICTLTLDGNFVSNSLVVQQIETLLGLEFVDYGYIKVTYWLREEKCYVINFKKVYRLMRENKLLLSPIPRNKSEKIWVKDLVPHPEIPFEYWELDIKYIYIHGARRNALLLSVIDVKSRWLMGSSLQWSIKQEDVSALLQSIIDDFILPKSVTVRNDNGSQFESNLVRTFLSNRNINQEFTRPATPEQNAHIESYHSILEKVICRRYCFESIESAREVFIRFEQFYNFHRIHSGVGYKSPYKYLLLLGIDLNKNKMVHLN